LNERKLSYTIFFSIHTVMHFNTTKKVNYGTFVSYYNKRPFFIRYSYQNYIFNISKCLVKLHFFSNGLDTKQNFFFYLKNNMREQANFFHLFYFYISRDIQKLNEIKLSYTIFFSSTFFINCSFNQNIGWRRLLLLLY